MFNTFKKILLVLGVSLSTSIFAADELRVVTEEYPPYNYTEAGKLIGVGTEVVQAMFAKAASSPNIEVMPWPRAYNEALTEANVMIYSISRTPQRETLFRWVGSILGVNTSFYKLKANAAVEVKSLEDAKKYTVGGIKQEVATQWLEKNNFKIHYSSGYANNLKLLRDKNLDLMVIDDVAFAYLLKQENLSLADFEKVFVVDDLHVENCVALGVKTSDEVFNKYKKALDDVKATPVYQAIVDKYST